MGYDDDNKSWTCCGWIWWSLVAFFGLIAIAGLFPLFTGSVAGPFNNVVGLKVENAKFEVTYEDNNGNTQTTEAEVNINMLLNPVWNIEYGMSFKVASGPNGQMEERKCGEKKAIKCSTKDDSKWIKCSMTTWLWVCFGGYLVFLFAAICLSCVNWNKVALLTVFLALGSAGAGFYFIYDSSWSYVQNFDDWSKVEEFICTATDSSANCIQDLAQTCDNGLVVDAAGMFKIPTPSSSILVFTQNGLFTIAAAIVCLLLFIVGLMVFSCCTSKCCVRDESDNMVSL